MNAKSFMVVVAGLILVALLESVREESIVLQAKEFAVVLISAPTDGPTVSPTSQPTLAQTRAPINHPTKSPTGEPTSEPTLKPTRVPTAVTTFSPTAQTLEPSALSTFDSSTAPSSAIPKTPRPTIPIDISCLNQRRPVTRPRDLRWDCAIGINKSLEDDGKVYKFSELPSEIINETGVVFLDGENWGQLCNKIGILAGCLNWMKRDNLRNKTWALTPQMTDAIWSMDIKLLSSAVRALLLDCNACAPPPTKTEFLKCSQMYFEGKVYDVSTHVFSAEKVYWIIDLYWRNRPRWVGSLPEVADYFRPSSLVRDLTERLYSKFAEESAKRKLDTVGIHRRYMDSMCYAWFERQGEYNCHPRGTRGQEADKFAALRAEMGKDYWERSDLMRKMNDTERVFIESKAPWALSCNYSFMPHQVALINQTMPILIPNRLSFLLADDRLTEKGRSLLLKSEYVAFNWDIIASERPNCLADKKHHSMLVDMLAMTKTKYHFGMVLSSCDDIVSIWRKQAGHPKGTAWPGTCYDGWYD